MAVLRLLLLLPWFNKSSSSLISRILTENACKTCDYWRDLETQGQSSHLFCKRKTIDFDKTIACGNAGNIITYQNCIYSYF